MEADGSFREADEEDGRVLRQGAPGSAAGSAGGGKRWIPRTLPLLWEEQKQARTLPIKGKRGAKINLLVDQSGAPLSVVLTGANRHETSSQPST